MRFWALPLLGSLVVLIPVGTAAQSEVDEGASPVLAALKALHDSSRDYIMDTAEIVPEDLYDFRPTEEVRTLGRILAHIAGAQYAFCSSAAREENPNSENFERTRTSKASIISALEESFAYCDEVYASTTDESGTLMTTLFGTPYASSGVLAGNSSHNFEHYGNLVTYMRMNGIVPPSSREH